MLRWITLVDLGHLLGRADQHERGLAGGRRAVPGRHVEGVAGLEHLGVVPVGERDLPGRDVAPVGARAAVVGEALEQAHHVGRLAEVQEADLIAVDDVLSDRSDPDVLHLRCGCSSIPSASLSPFADLQRGARGRRSHEAFAPSFGRDRRGQGTFASSRQRMLSSLSLNHAARPISGTFAMSPSQVTPGSS